MTERFQQIIKIAGLISAELTGNISDTDREELERWKKESPEHMLLYDRYKSEVFIAEKFRFVLENDKNKAYQDFKRKTEFVIRRKRKLIFYRYAGIIVLFITLGCIFYFFGNEPQEHEKVVAQKVHAGGLKAILTYPDGTEVDISDTTYLALVEKQVSKTVSGFHTITIPRGGEYSLTLSDGSHLRMNSESEIRIPEHFDAKLREVYMTGEIYFDIARDTTAPFMVHTPQGEITVLGTSFNVRDYSDETFLEATLVSGSVFFRLKGEDTYLKPGEQLRLNKENGESIVGEVDVRLYCSWKDGRFVFEKQRLEEIMNKISRWYNIYVSYESQSMKDILFTGNIKRYGDLDQVVEMLRLINKIEFEINGNNVFVKNNQ